MKEKEGDQLQPGWVWAPLGELGSWAGGGTPSKDNAAFWTDHGVPWVSPKDMKSFEVHDTEDHITDDAVIESATCKLPAGAVLMVTRSGILRHTFPVAVARVPVALNQDLKALTPHEGLFPDFVVYALRCFGKRILHRCSKDGTTVQSIEFPALKRFEIPIAPCQEQSRIADTLDELFSDLDAGVAALERVREKLKLYRASVLKAAVEGALTADWREQHPCTEPATYLLQRILAERRRRWEEDQLARFKARGQKPHNDWKAKYQEPVAPDPKKLPALPDGWCWVRAEQLCNFITKGTTPPGPDAPQPKGEIPFIRVQHLSGTGAFTFSASPAFVSRTTHEGFLARSIVFPLDVLMNIVGPPLGQVSIVPETFPEWNVNQAIAIFRPLSGLLHNFLSVCLLSWPVISQALRRTKTTAGQVNLTLEVCRDLAIPLPPLAEQEAIVEAVEDQLSVIDHLEADLDAKLKSAGALRQAILRHAFTGRLVPQDLNDEPASELLKRIAAEREARAGKAAHAKQPRKRVARRGKK